MSKYLSEDEMDAIEANPGATVPIPQDNSELYTEDEFDEAEYKLRTCIRITASADVYTTEVHTGARWVPITPYVKALLAAEREKILDGLGNIADSYEFEDEHGCKLVNRNHIDGFIASQRRKTE